MKKSLTLRILMVLGCSLLAFVFVISIVQSHFFSTYYHEEKVEALVSKTEEHIERFSGPYDSLEDVFSDYANASSSFEMNMKLLYKEGKHEVDPLTYLNKDRLYYSKTKVPYSIFSTPDGDVRELNMIRSNYLPSLDTTIVVVYAMSLKPVDEAMSMIQGFNRHFYIYGAILAVGIAVLLSRYITNPILYLSQVANRMEDMEQGARSNIRRSDEIGMLSNRMNSMYRRLENALTELHGEVEKHKMREALQREFIANASHELKTPVGSVRGFAQLISEGIRKEKNPHYIETIIQEADRMEHLITNMIEVSKADIQMRNANQAWINVADVLNDLERSYASVCIEKMLEIDRQGQFGQIFLTRDQVYSIFDNLMSNAIRYTSGRSVKIRGNCTDASCRFEITNESRELTQEELTKIWDRFYKVDKGRNREGGGTGLGLSIVKAICSQNTIDLGVERSGHHVTFYIEYPTRTL